jgi:hypothetical protein
VQLRRLALALTVFHINVSHIPSLQPNFLLFFDIAIYDEHNYCLIVFLFCTKNNVLKSNEKPEMDKKTKTNIKKKQQGENNQKSFRNKVCW